MSSKRVFAIAAVLAGLGGSAAFAQANSTVPADSKPVTTPKPAAEERSDAKPAEAKKHSRAEVEAFLAKCSQEADEKGLDVKKGKGAERKAYRRECMKKFGVVAK